LDNIGNIDSKYRFVILASKRAKQLLKGAKPKIKAKSRNLIRIAQSEVKAGLVDYELIPTGREEIPDQDERVFVGAEIAVDEGTETEAVGGKDLVEEESDKDLEGELEGEDDEAGEADEDVEGRPKGDKDE
jgi:DNA-directed RNA polymerase omega subunit